jgi:hypothetical protein
MKCSVKTCDEGSKFLLQAREVSSRLLKEKGKISNSYYPWSRVPGFFNAVWDSVT